MGITISSLGKSHSEKEKHRKADVSTVTPRSVKELDTSGRGCCRHGHGRYVISLLSNMASQSFSLSKGCRFHVFHPLRCRQQSPISCKDFLPPQNRPHRYLTLQILRSSPFQQQALKAAEQKTFPIFLHPLHPFIFSPSMPAHAKRAAHQSKETLHSGSYQEHQGEDPLSQQFLPMLCPKRL